MSLRFIEIGRFQHPEFGQKIVGRTIFQSKYTGHEWIRFIFFFWEKVRNVLALLASMPELDFPTVPIESRTNSMIEFSWENQRSAKIIEAT